MLRFQIALRQQYVTIHCGRAGLRFGGTRVCRHSRNAILRPISAIGRAGLDRSGGFQGRDGTGRGGRVDRIDRNRKSSPVRLSPSSDSFAVSTPPSHNKGQHSNTKEDQRKYEWQVGFNDCQLPIASPVLSFVKQIPFSLKEWIRQLLFEVVKR